MSDCSKSFTIIGDISLSKIDSINEQTGLKCFPIVHYKIKTHLLLLGTMIHW